MRDRRTLILPAIAIVLVMTGLTAFLPGRPSPEPMALDIAEAGSGGPGAGEWIGRLTGHVRILERRAAAAPVVEDDPFEGYALIGIVESGDDSWALLSAAGVTWTLRQGAVLNEYQLMQILADRVVFERDGRQVTLRLSR